MAVVDFSVVLDVARQEKELWLKDLQAEACLSPVESSEAC